MQLNTRVALTVVEPNGEQDIWVYHLERGTLSRVTYSGSSKNPVWSLGGQTLVFEDQQSGLGLWEVNSSGVGIVERLVASTSPRTAPKSFNPGGSQLVYMEDSGDGWDIGLLNFDDAEISQRPLLNSEFEEWDPSISPDGQWLAYKSDETGRFEVYVRPFPDVNADKIQVSTNGGREPQWSRDGNSLFYIDDSESTLVAVPVDFESEFTFGAAVTKLSLTYALDPPSYVVLADDRSFLIQKQLNSAADARIVPRAVNAVLVGNWFEELKRLAPPDPR